MTHDEAIEISANYMQEKGWYIRHRCWEYDHRRLDLVCIDGDMSQLLFLDVEIQGGCNQHSADDIKVTVGIYLSDSFLENLPVRFDSINVGHYSDGAIKIKHKEGVKHIDPYYFYDKMRDKQRIQKLTSNAKSYDEVLSTRPQHSIRSKLKRRLKALLTSFTRNNDMEIDTDAEYLIHF